MDRASARPRHVLAGIAAAVAAAAAIFIARESNLGDLLANAARIFADIGPWGYAAYLGLYVSACVFMIPGSALTLAAGAVYGVGRGFPLVLASATAGATAAFLVGRHVARGWVEPRVAADPRFAALDAAVGREGLKLVLLTRLSPVFPFNLLNYAFGLTSVRLRDYMLGSAVGMMPGTLLYVYLGALAGQVLRPDTPAPTAVWGARLLGLAATVAVTVSAARLAKRALARQPADRSGMTLGAQSPVDKSHRTTPIREGGQ